MNRARIVELCDSIIYLANDAKLAAVAPRAADDDILDCLDLIEGDVGRIRDEGGLKESE